MSYLKSSLSMHEKIEKDIQLHWISFYGIVLFNLAYSCLVLVSLFKGWPMSWKIVGSVFLIGNIFFGFKSLNLFFVEQGVTNKRVVHKKGIMSIQTIEMKLSSIETIDLNQSILGRILNYGDVHITGKGVSDLNFHNIKDPLDVKILIESIAPSILSEDTDG